MTLFELNILTEDELAMLWCIVNKIAPPVISFYELDPKQFTSIKRDKLIERVKKSESFITDEHKYIYDGLLKKLTTDHSKEENTNV